MTYRTSTVDYPEEVCEILLRFLSMTFTPPLSTFKNFRTIIKFETIFNSSLPTLIYRLLNWYSYFIAISDDDLSFATPFYQSFMKDLCTITITPTCITYIEIIIELIFTCCSRIPECIFISLP